MRVDVLSEDAISDDAIYIVGVGAQTPVGRSVLAAAAAVRCGISAYAEHPFMLDRYGEPMVVAALAADAAREALGTIGGVVRADELRVHLALSADTLPDPAARAWVGAAVSAAVGALVGAATVRGGSCAADIVLTVEGHAGGLLALERAVGELRRGEARLCLVGGADSWIDVDALDAVDGAGLLHSVNQSWGFTPGEGAGCCLVTTGAAVRADGLQPLAELVAVGVAREANVLGAPGVCVGEGLTAAFRAVLDPGRPVARSYCDFNGETYRANEYGFAVGRMGACSADASHVTAAAESWGDVGAASGLLALTLPVAAWARGYGDRATQLVWSSSAVDTLRGAAVLRDVNSGEGMSRCR